ncbi:MAG: hypothetical protein ABEI96_04360 [Haloarculaceae archaeon]
MTARVAVVAGLIVTAAALGTVVAAVTGVAVAGGPARPAVGRAGVAAFDGRAAGGTDGPDVRDLGAAAEGARTANATVVERGENVTVVRRAWFDVSAATDRNYTSMRGEPVVADGRVYGVFTGNKVVGDAAKQRYFSSLYALNATTLEPDWRVEFPEAEPHGEPVVANGTVYLVVFEHNGSGPNTYVLHAFDEATGEQRWQREIGAVRYDDHLKAAATHNDLHPVYTLGGHVVTLTVAAGPQALVGLDPVTGEVDWRYEGVVAGVETDGQRLYAGYRPGTNVTEGGVVALDPTSGETLWTHPNGNYYGQLRVAAAADGRVYVTRPAPLNTSAVATVRALDAATGEEDYWVAAPGNTRIWPIGVYPSASTVVAVSWSPKNETAQPRSLVAVNDSAGRVQWAVDWNRLGQSWAVSAGERNLYIYSDGGVSATHASNLDGSSADGWFPPADWSQGFEDFNSVRDLDESGGDLYVLRTTTTGSGVSVYDGDSGDVRYEFDFDALSPAFTAVNDAIYVQSHGVVVSYAARPNDASATGTDSGGGNAASASGGTAASAGGDASTRTRSTDRPAMPAALSGRGPLGVPIPVLVGLVLGLATSVVLGGRRYRFGGG